jgi:uncharacterized protein (TIGR02145 family)
MKYRVKFQQIIILLIITVLFITSCKKVNLPRVETITVNHITQTDAYSGGRVTYDGGSNVYVNGVCWSTSENPTTRDSNTSDSLGVDTFISNITGLTPNTLYYVRAYASNKEGTGYGNQFSFTTAEVDIPTVATIGPQSVTATSSKGGGNITNDGGLTISERGVCWNTTGSPTLTDSHTSDGTGKGTFSSIIDALTVNTTYFVRAFATNSIGTAYGNEIEFIQILPVTDYDGNIYSIVKIGTQVWMGENLKTTRLNNGAVLPTSYIGEDWSALTTPAYCWYVDNIWVYKATYGALYNWYAVNTGKLCPTGWHVPSDAEFTTLVTYLGGEKLAGGRLKESGTSHWNTPNTGAMNNSGFTALPGGGRYNFYTDLGMFNDLGYYGYYWSSTSSTSTLAYSRDMGYNVELIYRGENPKHDGESVRCIRDN